MKLEYVWGSARTAAARPRLPFVAAKHHQIPIPLSAWVIVVALTAAADGGGSSTFFHGTTVRGRVTDQYGRPVAGANVIVAGQELVTLPDGSYTAIGVSSPYDLIHVGPPVVAYRGLTVMNPITAGTLPNTAEERPVILAGHVPVVSGEHTRVIFTAPGLTVEGRAADETGQYAIESRFNTGKLQYEGTLIALRAAWTYSEPGVRVTEYRASASRKVTVELESTLVVDIEPNEFERSRQVRIRGRVVRPRDYRLNSVVAFLEFGDELVRLHGLSSPMRQMADEFDLLVPFLEGATYVVGAWAVGGSPEEGITSPNNACVRGLKPPIGEVEVVLYPGPSLLQPPDGAIDVDSTTRFSWSESAGPGIYEFMLTPTKFDGPGFGARLKCWVYLAGTSTTLQDLPSVDFVRSPGAKGLIPGETYTWSVRKLHSMPRMDEASTRAMLHRYAWVSTSSTFRFTARQP